VAAEDVFAQGLGVKLFGFDVVSREAVFRMRNKDAAIGSTLHSTEDTGSGRRTSKANVKEAFEWTTIFTFVLRGFGELVLAISLFNTSKSISQIQFGESPTSNQEADAICGRPIGETMLDAVFLQLVTVSRAEDLVTGDLGGNDLTDDILIGEANDEAVFGGIVFVLGLGDETLASVVVGFTCTTTLVLGLKATVLVSGR